MQSSVAVVEESMAAISNIYNTVHPLINQLQQNSGEARIYTLETLSNLALESENQVPMASPELGLLPVLHAVVSSDSGEARVNALATLGNLSMATDNQVPMASAALGLVPVLKAVVSSDSGEARVEALRALRNLSSSIFTWFSSASVIIEF